MNVRREKRGRPTKITVDNLDDPMAAAAIVEILSRAAHHTMLNQQKQKRVEQAREASKKAAEARRKKGEKTRKRVQETGKVGKLSDRHIRRLLRKK